MLACSIPLDSDFALFFARCLCWARFIPHWKQNALWELINETYQNFAVFGFGEWETCPLWPSFAVCRIRGVPLISAFKQRFWVWIVLYPVSDKFVLTDKRIITTYHPHNFSLTCNRLRVHIKFMYFECCVGWTFACLEVNWMSTVRALYEHCLSTKIYELNLTVDWDISEIELELKKTVDSLRAGHRANWPPVSTTLPGCSTLGFQCGFSE